MLAINPGATSTELGYFNYDNELWHEVIDHYDDSLAPHVPDQLTLRLNKVKHCLDSALRIDAIGARGGPLKSLDSGVYKINQKMLSEYNSCKYANHASNLGALIADVLSKEYDAPAYIIDPVTTDEFIDIARVSGVPGIERKSRSHALNINYCVRKAAQDNDKDISNSNFIVAHLGSGFSIASIKNGKIIDTNDALLGMGPFSIERAGALPLSGIMDLAYDYKDRKALEHLLSKDSGLKGYLGTNKFPEIEKSILKSDKKAELAVDAMVYQIVKEVGGLYASLNGNISALIITGGLANSTLLINKIKDYVNFIDPIIIYPGSFELQALASAVLRILYGDEKPKIYS